MNGFLSVFPGEFRIIRAIRVQKLIPSSNNEKAIHSFARKGYTSLCATLMSRYTQIANCCLYTDLLDDIHL